MRRRLWWLFPLAFLTLALIRTVDAHAAVTRVEAETITAASPCWQANADASWSGGNARICNTSAIGLTIPFTVPASTTATVRLSGYRDGATRQFRYRIDGGSWVSGSTSGSESYTATLATTASVAAGSHTIELERTGAEWVYLDYIEVTDTPDPTTTTVAPTTTTAAPTTTTTAGGSTTTTLSAVDRIERNDLDVFAAVTGLCCGVFLGSQLLSAVR